MSQRLPRQRSQRAPVWRAFATTTPGLEHALADELVALGYERVMRGVAGASFMATREGLERACLVLRTAHRVLWTLGDVDAGDADRLYTSVRGLVKWDGFIPPEKTFAIRATARDNPNFRDARFVGMKTKDAIVDAVRELHGERPSVDVQDPDVQVRIAVSGRRGVLSLDLAGVASLHERGYRVDAGEAPLRESVAAGILAYAEHGADEMVFDPCCGSGTLLIEAALRARAVAPGLIGRSYGFERWPGFQRERFDHMKDALVDDTRGPVPRRYLGTDLAGDVLRVARDNATRARVSEDIRLVREDATRWTPPDDFPRGPGLIVTNPPWGERLGDKPAADRMMQEMGRRWREVLPGWRAAVLVGDAMQSQLLGLHGTRVLPLDNGGLSVALVLGHVPA